ncbi:MAG: hypothetical protein NTY59_16620 [Alphaproteobacteria bacterium]|nr:hypothetical protein [Alphaproteobacteria bacterium]
MIYAWRRLASAALFAVLLCFHAPAHADGPLTTVGTFPGTDTQLEIQTFEQNNKKVGLIDLSAGPDHASFIIDAALSEQVLDIWSKAKSNQAGSWSPVGTITENRASNATSIAVSAGFGVRLILSDPKQGSFTHVVAREDMTAFEAALQKVAAFLKP